MSQLSSLRRITKVRVYPSVVLSLVLGVLVLPLSFSGVGLAKTTITFWTDWGGDGLAALESIATNFNKSQSAIEVKITATGDLNTKLLTAIAGNAAPDLVLLDRYRTGEMAARKALTPLDSYLARKDTTITPDDFFRAAWNETIYEGTVYSVPFYVDNRVLFYNIPRFEEAGLNAERPPQDWDDLVEYSRKLTSRGPDGRLKTVGYVPIWHGVSLTHYMWQNGTDVFNADQTRVIFDQQPSVEALDWVVRFVDMYGGVAALNELSGQFGSGAKDPLVTGQEAMKSDGNWMYGDMKKAVPQFIEKDLGLAPLPKGKQYATIAGGFSLAIPVNAKQKDAAWKFLQFAVSKESQLLFAQRAGSIPALLAAAKDPAIIGNRFWRPFILSMEFARYRPVHPAFPEIEGFIYQAVDEAVNHRLSPQAALKQAAEKAQPILDRYNKHFRR